jgi:hypothetical protein
VLKASAAETSALAASSAPASTVSLYGDVAALNAYLHAGKLRFSTSGADTITVTVTSGDFVTTSTLSVEVQGNSAQARTGPALAIPTLLNVPVADGLIALTADGVLYASASGTGSGSDLLTLVISIPGSIALATGEGLALVSAEGSPAATPSAPARTLTLTGTAAQLNAMLRGAEGADRVRYLGPVTTPLQFSITEQASTDGAPITATALSRVNTVSLSAAANPDVSETSASFATLPTQVWVTPNIDSDLRLTGATISVHASDAADMLSLRVVPDAGSTCRMTGYPSIPLLGTTKSAVRPLRCRLIFRRPARSATAVAPRLSRLNSETATASSTRPCRCRSRPPPSRPSSRLRPSRPRITEPRRAWCYRRS